jgi:protease-4
MSEWDSGKNDGKPGWNDQPAAVAAASEEKQSRQDRKLIDKLVMSMQVEQRRSRRWGIFFKFLTFAYLFGIVLLFKFPLGQGLDSATGGIHTAVIGVDGPIAADELASADNLVSSLRAAFEEPDAAAVILCINSPGGSPVQSGYVYDEIKRLRAEYPDKKVYAVISDIGASGAYYIASAADEIYANRASLVGSIGVVAGGFGFTEVMGKLGVERRLYTAGESKGFLDPFSAEKPEEVAFWQSVLENTHGQFIAAVQQGRGDRLADDPRVFSGLIWSGKQALELGLIDGLGSASYVARQIVGHENLVDYSRARSPLRNLMEQLGVSVGHGVAQYVSEQRLELR